MFKLGFPNCEVQETYKALIGLSFIHTNNEMHLEHVEEVFN